MTKIRVFSPDAMKVELIAFGDSMNMSNGESGWWERDAPFCHGTDYAFRIDGKGPYPDPRSSWQPHGVHGDSRWLDHQQFEWHDKEWKPPSLQSAIFYELHIGTFTQEGTFDSALSRLDYLAELGITHVEMMPVAEFAGNRGWGYDGVNLFAPHHAYGGPEGLKRFVNHCHQKGLAVILDVVYNHLGPEGNYLAFFGPYFTNKYSTPWGEALNLDGPGSVEVRRFIIDNALMWLRDYHFDGLRIDAVHAILDTSSFHILEELAANVKKLEDEIGRPLVLIAESDLNDPRIIRPPSAGGYGLDAEWNEDFHHALHAVLTKESSGYYQDFGKLADLAKALTKGFVYDGRYSRFRRRIHGKEAKGALGTQFIGFLQNHDQVGNRAQGERVSHLVSEGDIKIGSALVMTSPFLPLLFQGEEWAASTPFLFFTDFQDPHLKEEVKRGRQNEFSSFGWKPEEIPDPHSLDTYLRSKLRWEEQKHEPNACILKWYRRLIHYRRKEEDLKDPQLDHCSVEYHERERWLILKRGAIFVMCNFSDVRRPLPSKNSIPQIASEEGIVKENSSYILPPHSVLIAKRVEK